ncbi:MAG: helix-turn-helix transcriptional regulator [Bacteroidales bacterium]|nr:helix-turn-helix transcriptional regulator [Bacteroidales bacterium]
MKHAAETERLFLKVTDETPDEIKMKVDWSLDISTAIDNALRKKRMTKRELAARLGTSPASVHSWLGGCHNFTLSTLARISAVLGVPLISVAK